MAAHLMSTLGQDNGASPPAGRSAELSDNQRIRRFNEGSLGSEHQTSYFTGKSWSCFVHFLGRELDHLPEKLSWNKSQGSFYSFRFTKIRFYERAAVWLCGLEAGIVK